MYEEMFELSNKDHHIESLFEKNKIVGVAVPGTNEHFFCFWTILGKLLWDISISTQS